MQPTQATAITLGNWNPKIFTPAWVKDRLLQLKGDEGIEVLLDFNEMDFSLRYNSIIISPKRTVLELQVKSFNEEDKQLFTRCLMGIFELLPQTPIKAIGINIIYILNEGEEKAYKAILDRCNYFEGFAITMLRYTLKHEKYTTNILVEKETDTSIKVNFNFHYIKTTDIDDAFLEKHILESQKLLNHGI